jgi:hypothetical protein
MVEGWAHWAHHWNAGEVFSYSFVEPFSISGTVLTPSVRATLAFEFKLC